ncbi:hypothetical protein VZT92_019409 [Zoarces viviparus]|uniref:Uncharacterized protein n=1 Tax=Zoarces viviparus TaxID=48416 RepID=A0AAW1ELB6_ZOAVI
MEVFSFRPPPAFAISMSLHSSSSEFTISSAADHRLLEEAQQHHRLPPGPLRAGSSAPSFTGPSPITTYFKHFDTARPGRPNENSSVTARQNSTSQFTQWFTDN